MRKAKLVNKKFVMRTMACVMTVAMVGSSTYGYTTWAEQDTKEETTSESTEKSEVEKAIDKIVTVDEKEIGKEETVYVIADNTGKATSTIVSEHLKNPDGSDVIVDKSDLKDIVNVNGDESFTQDGEKITWNAKGSDIYYQGTTDKEAPVSVKVTYKLDGKEVSADQIAGKSGKVTVRFDYTNNEKTKADINGEEKEIYVPFITISGMLLDDSFSNIEVKNGKVVSDGKNNVVVGMAMPGMKESLELNDDSDYEIPEYVEMTADVKDFKLDMTMTVAMCNTGMDISDIDLTDIDETVDELDDATKQLEDGSKELADGIGTLKGKLPEFKSGVSTLKDGITEYTKGTSKLSKGIGTLYSSTGALVKGMKSIDTAVDAIYTNFGTKKNQKTIRGGAKSLADGAKSADTGVKKLSEGTSKLKTGSSTLSTGTAQLDAGIGELATNTKKLSEGAKSVSDGAAELNSGIGTLISSVNQLSATVGDNVEKIDAGLKKAGFDSAKEAKTGLENLKTLQSAIITCMAYGNYDAVAKYGITAENAVEKLKGYNTQIETLTQTLAQRDTLTTVASKMSGKEDDIKKLTEGAKSLKDGAKEVSDGVSKVDTAVGTIKTNTTKIASGAKDVASGIKEVDDNMGTLKKGTKQLADGSASLDTGIETLYTKAISPLNSGVDTLVAKVPTLQSGIKQLNSGATKLVSNNKKLNNGTKSLLNGTDSIVDGVGKLGDGANDLASGIKEFDQKAIKKIISAYNGDIKDLVDRINAVVDAGENYTTFTKKADDVEGNVKFIIKTDSVKAKDEK